MNRQHRCWLFEMLLNNFLLRHPTVVNLMNCVFRPWMNWILLCSKLWLTDSLWETIIIRFLHKNNVSIKVVSMLFSRQYFFFVFNIVRSLQKSTFNFFSFSNIVLDSKKLINFLPFKLSNFNVPHCFDTRSFILFIRLEYRNLSWIFKLFWQV